MTRKQLAQVLKKQINGMLKGHKIKDFRKNHQNMIDSVIVHNFPNGVGEYLGHSMLSGTLLIQDYVKYVFDIREKFFGS